MENDNKLTYIDQDGNEVLCEILFTYKSEEFNKNYVLFYPVGNEEDEEIEVIAASYEPQEDDSIGELHDIETDEEWEMIEDLLDTYINSEEEEYDEDDEENEDEE